MVVATALTGDGYTEEVRALGDGVSVELKHARDYLVGSYRGDLTAGRLFFLIVDRLDSDCAKTPLRIARLLIFLALFVTPAAWALVMVVDFLRAAPTVVERMRSLRAGYGALAASDQRRFRFDAVLPLLMADDIKGLLTTLGLPFFSYPNNKLGMMTKAFWNWTRRGIAVVPHPSGIGETALYALKDDFFGFLDDSRAARSVLLKHIGGVRNSFVFEGVVNLAGNEMTFLYVLGGNNDLGGGMIRAYYAANPNGRLEAQNGYLKGRQVPLLRDLKRMANMFPLPDDDDDDDDDPRAGYFPEYRIGDAHGFWFAHLWLSSNQGGISEMADMFEFLLPFFPIRIGLTNLDDGDFTDTYDEAIEQAPNVDCPGGCGCTGMCGRLFVSAHSPLSLLDPDSLQAVRANDNEMQRHHNGNAGPHFRYQAYRAVASNAGAKARERLFLDMEFAIRGWYPGLPLTGYRTCAIEDEDDELQLGGGSDSDSDSDDDDDDAGGPPNPAAPPAPVVVPPAAAPPSSDEDNDDDAAGADPASPSPDVVHHAGVLARALSWIWG